jgi:myo-inositol-1(or 4)-monophosphatase
MSFTEQELSEFQQASQAAARLGGECLMRWLGKVDVKEKNPRDLVTQADLESQKAIESHLLSKFPNHSFVGEESENHNGFPPPPDKFCWIVDPLDGTTNYVHQLRSFSVSIALRYGDKTIVGTVYDPATDECYSASIGNGATLNDVPIGNSGCTELKKALVICSFRSSVTRDDPEVERFLRILGKAGCLRRLGSAALNLCYVGCGRADAYWATSLNCWDIAAGWLILQECGGVMLTIEGNEVDLGEPKFCAASTTELYEQMKPLLNL